MDKQEKADKLEQLDYDIYINLLSCRDYEAIGKLVIDKLMEAKSGSKFMARHILICGS